MTNKMLCPKMAHAGFNYVLSSDSKHIIGLNEKRFILQDNWMKFKV